MGETYLRSLWLTLLPKLVLTPWYKPLSPLRKCDASRASAPAARIASAIPRVRREGGGLKVKELLWRREGTECGERI